MIDTLCFSGGGTKGISYIGVLSYLDKHDYLKLSNIKKYAGTSSGSIISFFLILGYTPDELKDFVLKFNFNKFEPDINCNIFLSKYGMDNGEKLITAIRTFLNQKFNKQDITFSELYDLTNKELEVFTTNYTKGCSEVFSYKNTPDMSVILAIRMSISVPLLFTPVEYNNNFYVDGGITVNFPLKFYNPETSLGIAIVNRRENNLNSLYSYLFGLCSIAMDTISLNAIRLDKNNKYNFIEINCELKSGLDFSLKKDIIEELLLEGEKFAKKYYSNFISKQIINELIENCVKIDNLSTK